MEAERDIHREKLLFKSNGRFGFPYWNTCSTLAAATVGQRTKTPSRPLGLQKIWDMNVYGFADIITSVT